MASDNKILTVSYGTFSCTLEGFDDPFSAMRSIAEYFRDLAADDRFFGAEPPTPDPQMLQSLAEKEVKRRIESRVENNGLVLRQMDQEEAQPAPAAPAPQAAPSRAETPREPPQPAAAQAETPEPAAAKPRTASATALAAHAAGLAASAATAETSTASIADKLERIRAAVAQRSEAQFVEDQPIAELPTATVQPTEGTEDDLDADPELEDRFNDEAKADEIAEVSLGDTPTETAVTERAPVAEEAVEEDEALELPPEEGPVAKIAPPVVETSEVEAETPETADAHAPDINLAADIADAEAQSEDDAAEAPAPSRRVRVVKMRRTDFEAAAPQAPAPKTDETAGEAADDVPALDEDLELTEALSAELDLDSLDLDSDVAPSAAPDDPDADLLQDLAAITEDDTVSETLEIAPDLIDDDLAADLSDDPFEATEENTTSDDLTADLDAALATAPSEPSHAEDARNVFDASEASMSRLMDETDKEMAKGENTRRRNAIQHLKAAVGAIRAEKSHTPDTEALKDETEAYKEDLAQVVKPSRPASPATPTRRNLPPLMLVSEQRIDDPKSAVAQTAAKPVQPRRLSSSALALKEEEEFQDDLSEATSLDTNMSFREFAEANGAVDLADVIEAAAAYLYFVEDREAVVRPKIMRTVRKVIPAEVPHEDRLRAFGKLLRQGKIKKVARGQFAVAPTTHFKPH
nr:hypothetical protein [uncultured Celeribacter sp.]